jgi:hypothetical protein
VGQLLYGMIRHSPCELYVKYLLSHPDTYSNDAVIDLLRLKHLDFVGRNYLDRLRGDMYIPSPFIPNDQLHWPSVNFMLRHRLTFLYHPDVFTLEALDTLDDAQGKSTVESMLLTDDPPGLIMYRLRAQGIRCSEAKTVERYKYFFFNTDLVDETEIRALVKLRYEVVGRDEDEYDTQARMAMKSSSYRDIRKIVLNQPIKQLGSLLNQLRMGYLPSQLELAGLLNSTRVASLVQANAAAMIGGQDGATTTRDYATALAALTEILEKIGSPEASLSKDLQLLGVRTQEAELPHVLQLTNGNHTTDLQLTNEREHIDA